MFSIKHSLNAVDHNLKWFLNSGVMRPSDGFWGVAERLARTNDNAAAEQMLTSFPCYSRIGDGVVAMEHRRADCCLQVAWLFELASVALNRPALRDITDNILAYLTQRSGLRQRNEKASSFGLWGWSNPVNQTVYYTDDNAWVIILLLKLAKNDRPDLKPLAIQTARTMHGHIRTYLERLNEVGWENKNSNPAEDIPMSGLLVNPHWFGLACMALAHAASVDPDYVYRDVIGTYFSLSLKGPPASQQSHRPAAGLTRPWPLSEYAYLALAASVVAHHIPDNSAEAAAQQAGEMLLNSQFPDGHFPAEHGETPTAPHLADLIYTDNWASLGLLHLHAWSGDVAYENAAQRTLSFLASIQDVSSDPRFAGCWRGMYDIASGNWGGGDRYEGGANSIYSGWTNAPIAWSFLINSGTGSLFVD